MTICLVIGFGETKTMSECPNKTVCGSCSWSEMPYDVQCAKKLSEVNSAFHTHKLSYSVSELIPSPLSSHYRNRMDFVIDFEGRVGLRQKGKWWRVIDNHCCFISDSHIERLFFVVRDWVRAAGLSYFDRKKHTGLLRFALIRASLSGEALVSIITSVPTEQETALLDEQLKKLAENPLCTSVVWSVNSTIADVSVGEVRSVYKGTGYLEEEVRGLSYRISPHAFFQTNSHTAGILIDTLRTWAKAAGTKRLLDLYCGSGFFSIALANQCEAVCGVEIVPEAVQDAKENARRNKVNVQYELIASENYEWGAFEADSVIVDPPRGGMHERALQRLVSVNPERIFYVSCNYKHFMSDLVTLEQHYQPRHMLLVDQFPHTPHVELLAWLERRA